MYSQTHNSNNNFIKVYFLYCFVQRHVSALVMSHLQVGFFFFFAVALRPNAGHGLLILEVL